jgi:hypothetical protein
MSPPGKQRPPAADPGGEQGNDLEGHGHYTEQRYRHGPDSPTIGALRRSLGITGWTPEARHAFAMALVEEARRRALLERLDSIMHFLAVGGTVDQATIRLAVLMHDLDPEWGFFAREAAAA